jgi:hypothetical protein
MWFKKKRKVFGRHRVFTVSTKVDSLVPVPSKTVGPLSNSKNLAPLHVTN